MTATRSSLWLAGASLLCFGVAGPDACAATMPFRLSSFSVDVTIPLDHRCMGVLPVKSRRIVDPLLARGFVLQGGGEPIVLVAVDWCEIRNDSYDEWRARLADVVGTRRERVFVCSVHQHDAPVVDAGAARLSADVGLAGEFVHYQLRAQQMSPDRLVMAIGFGECWPGYIPTDQAFREGFADKWLWVAPGSEAHLLGAMRRVLRPAAQAADSRENR